MFLLSFISIWCIAHACSFGSEPGVWAVSQWKERLGIPGLLSYRRLDDSKDSLWFDHSIENPNIPFGASWITLNRKCVMSNELALFWSPYFVQRRTILILGDSNDSHLLNYLCAEYSQRGRTGWAAYVNSPNIMNYCVLPSGLTIFQMYIKGVFTGDVSPAYAARDFFLNGTDRHDGTEPETVSQRFGRASEVQQLYTLKPDLVLVSSSYWTLQQFTENLKNADEETPDLVDHVTLRQFSWRMQHLIELCRKLFPTAKVALRTSHEIRTSCDKDGTNSDGSNKRVWGKRAWVSQVNSAIRQVARATDAELVDLQMMADAFTPQKTTSDDIHFKAWLGLELINVLLNI